MIFKYFLLGGPPAHNPQHLGLHLACLHSLHHMVKKGVHWHWVEERQATFDQAKILVAQAQASDHGMVLDLVSLDPRCITQD